MKIHSIKGPLKYLVAKLHGCYPGANSLPVSQNFFARFFRRRSVADSSRCLTFLLRCNKHKKLFLLTIFFINVLLYGYNMWVVPLFFKLSCFAWKLHPRTGVLTESRSDGCMLMGKFRKDDSNTISSVRLGIEISKMRRYKLKLVLRYSHLQTMCPRPFWPLRNFLKSFAINCATLWTCVRELSFRTWETPLFRYNTNKRSYRGH